MSGTVHIGTMMKIAGVWEPADHQRWPSTNSLMKDVALKQALHWPNEIAIVHYIATADGNKISPFFVYVEAEMVSC